MITEPITPRPHRGRAVPIALVCQRAGITYRQLDYWLRAKLIPLADTAEGSGSQRRIYPADVNYIIRFAKLVRAGLSHEVAVKVIEQLDTTGFAHLTDDIVLYIKKSDDDD